MADRFSKIYDTPEAPARYAAVVTPDDNTDLAQTSKALYIGGTGDVTVITMGGDQVTFSGVQGGTFLPLRVTRVKATGTDATGIVALS